MVAQQAAWERTSARTFPAQVGPEVPSVADLHCFGEGLADRLAVGGGAVAADVLDPGVLAQPRGQGPGGAVGQDVDPLAGLGVDEHCRVAVPALEREVVDAEHTRDARRRHHLAHEHAQGGRAGDRAGQRAGEAGARPAR